MNKIISILAGLMLFCIAAYSQDSGSVKLQTLDGGNTTPAEWTDGKTPYVVSFWFVTCQYCLEEMDAISERWEEWQAEKPFRFIAVCTDDTRSLSRAKALVRSRGWDGFQFVFDVNKEFARAKKVTSCPHVFVFDKNGKQVYSHLGYSPGDEEKLFEVLRSLDY